MAQGLKPFVDIWIHGIDSFVDIHDHYLQYIPEYIYYPTWHPPSCCAIAPRTPQWKRYQLQRP